MLLQTKPYDGEKTVNYAVQWAMRRNPQFYDYSNLGGDCTNFASQALYHGAGVMNYTPLYGWYYINGNEKSPSWTGVNYLYQFLSGNLNQGPFAVAGMLAEIQPGDFIQLSFTNPQHFNHTLVVTKIGSPVTLDNIYIATHSPDSLHRQLSTYRWIAIRFIHILGVHY
ncbi:MAG TPA: amidase [Firmicutes bacterium]|jgi:hypothetical protein|nr:amidase [Bacillota bacterium]